MSSINIQYFKTPFGELILGSFQGKLCLADWRYRKMRTRIDNRIQSELGATYLEKSSRAIEQTIIQLNEYYHKERTHFDIALLFVGTEFQKKIWTALIEIPYGTTVSYLELSKKIKNQKAVRAVASANGANAIAILVPCHRIIGSNGELTGYAGGLNTKKKILELEGVLLNNQLSLF